MAIRWSLTRTLGDYEFVIARGEMGDGGLLEKGQRGRKGYKS